MLRPPSGCAFRAALPVRHRRRAPATSPSCGRSATSRRRASGPRSSSLEASGVSADVRRRDAPVLEVDRPRQGLPGPPVARGSAVDQARRAGRVRRLVHARPRRDARPGRRERVGQDHRRALRAAAASSRRPGRSSSRASSSSALDRNELRPLRREMQIVFQDPYASLDPRLTVGAAIAEPLQIHKIEGDHDDAGRRAARARRAGARPRQALPARVLRRSAPAHRHRPGAGPRPDVHRARRAGVGARRVDPGRRRQPARRTCRTSSACRYLFIAHDLSVVRHISDTVAVMYLGKLVEVGPAEDVYTAAAHPYTQALLSAIPEPDPVIERDRAADRARRATSRARSTRRRAAGSAPAARRPQAIVRRAKSPS